MPQFLSPKKCHLIQSIYCGRYYVFPFLKMVLEFLLELKSEPSHKLFNCHQSQPVFGSYFMRTILGTKSGEQSV